MSGQILSFGDNFSTVCYLVCVLCDDTCRYLNIYVGMPDVEEGYNITKPISPHEVMHPEIFIKLPVFKVV